MGTFIDLDLLRGTAARILDKLGVQLPSRSKIQFIGDAVTAEDDPIEGVTKLSFEKGGAGNGELELGVTGSPTVGDPLFTDPADTSKVKKQFSRHFRGYTKTTPANGKVKLHGPGSVAPQSITGLPVTTTEGWAAVIDPTTLATYAVEFADQEHVVSGLTKSGGSVLVGYAFPIGYSRRIQPRGLVTSLTSATWASEANARANTIVLNDTLARTRTTANGCTIILPGGQIPVWLPWWIDAGELGALSNSQNIRIEGTGVGAGTNLGTSFYFMGPAAHPAIGDVQRLPTVGDQQKNTPITFSGTPTITDFVYVRYTSSSAAEFRRGYLGSWTACAIGAGVALTGTGLTADIPVPVDTTELQRVFVAKPPSKTSTASGTVVGAGAITADKTGTGTGSVTITGEPIFTGKFRLLIVQGGTGTTATWIATYDRNEGVGYFPSYTLTKTYSAFPTPVVGIRSAAPLAGQWIKRHVLPTRVRVHTAGVPGVAKFEIDPGTGVYGAPIQSQGGRRLTQRDGVSTSDGSEVEVGWIYTGLASDLGVHFYFAEGTYEAGRVITFQFGGPITASTSAVAIPNTGLSVTFSGGGQTFVAGDVFDGDTTACPNMGTVIMTTNVAYEDIAHYSPGGSSVIPVVATHPPHGGGICSNVTLDRCGYYAEGGFTSQTTPRHAIMIASPIATGMTNIPNCDFIKTPGLHALGFHAGHVICNQSDIGQSFGNQHSDCGISQCHGLLYQRTGSAEIQRFFCDDLSGPILAAKAGSYRLNGIRSEACTALVSIDNASDVTGTLEMTGLECSVGQNRDGLPGTGNISGVVISATAIGGPVKIGGGYLLTAYEDEPCYINISLGGNNVGVTEIANLSMSRELDEVVKYIVGSTTGGGYEARNISLRFRTHEYDSGLIEKYARARDGTREFGPSIGARRSLVNAVVSPTHEPINNAPVLYTHTGTSSEFVVYLPRLDNGSAVRWKASIVTKSAGAATASIVSVLAAAGAVSIVLNAAPGGGESVTILLEPTRTVSAGTNPIDPVAAVGVAPDIWYRADALVIPKTDGVTVEGWRDISGNGHHAVAPGGNEPSIVRDHFRTTMAVEIGEDAGVTPRYLAADLTAGSPLSDAFTFVFVMDLNSSRDAVWVGHRDAALNGGFVIYVLAGQIWLNYFAGGIGTNVGQTVETITDTAPHVITLSRPAGGNPIVRLDGNQLTWISPPAGPGTVAPANCQLYLGLNAPFGGAHRMTELLVFANSFTNSQLTALESQLSALYIG